MMKRRRSARWNSSCDGHRDVCEERTTAKEIGDALVLRVRSVPLDPLDAALPARFNGIVYEISERIAGNERLLGRRIVGRLGAPFPFVIGAFGRPTETIDLGPKIDDKEFLSITTGMSSEALYGASQLSFGEQLDAIERYFDASWVKVAERARGLWESIAVVRGGAQGEELRVRIVRMLASDDPRRMRAALNCLHRLLAANRAFAQDRILELAFSPLLTTTYAPLFESLRSQLRSPAEPFPEALRERAKARFVGDATLTLNQRQILFMFVVRGNSDTRREAVDMTFSLQGIPVRGFGSRDPRRRPRRVGAQSARAMDQRGGRSPDCANAGRAEPTAQPLSLRLPLQPLRVEGAEGRAGGAGPRTAGRRRSGGRARRGADQEFEAPDRDHPDQHQLVTASMSGCRCA